MPPPLSWTDQVTAVDCPGPVPLTVAVKVSVPCGVVVALSGLMVTETTGAAVTTTVAVSCWLGSSTLLTTTWKVPVTAGATYFPEASMVPPPLSWTDQLTSVDCPGAVPVTVAWN